MVCLPTDICVTRPQWVNVVQSHPSDAPMTTHRLVSTLHRLIAYHTEEYYTKLKLHKTLEKSRLHIWYMEVQSTIRNQNVKQWKPFVSKLKMIQPQYLHSINCFWIKLISGPLCSDLDVLTPKGNPWEMIRDKFRPTKLNIKIKGIVSLRLTDPVNLFVTYFTCSLVCLWY